MRLTGDPPREVGATPGRGASAPTSLSGQTEEAPAVTGAMTRKVGPSMSIPTLEVALFDGLDVPQILPHDSARARRTDPIQSHLAADRSAKSLPVVKRRVLRLLAHPDRKRVTGNEINDLYREAALKSGWDLGRFDTPRKRAGDLARAGLLKAEREIDGRTLPEAVYTITQRGLAALVNEVNL